MRPPYFLAIALLAALALAGCGRRGPLELPPGAPPVATAASPASGTAQDRVLNNEDTPGLIQSPDKVIQRTAAQKQDDVFHEGDVPRPINAPPQPKTGFFLDPLL